MFGFARCRSAAALLAALLALTAGAAACAIDQRIREKSQDLSGDLMEKAVDFNRMIAWQYFDAAAAVVVPQSRGNFLMTAESFNQRVHIESFTVVLTEVSEHPFTRLRGQVPEIQHEKKPQIEPPPTEDEVAAAARKAQATPEPSKAKTMPKNWYGLVLVRYVNLSILPHTQVRSPLLRQYWYWNDTDETWMVDPEIEQLLDLDKSEAAPPLGEKPLAPSPH
jgi:hypothetical protein